MAVSVTARQLDTRLGLAALLALTSSVAAYTAAEYRQGLWLVWVAPFLVAAWIGWQVRRPGAAGVLALAYAASLWPAHTLALIRLSGGYTSGALDGKIALYGIGGTILLITVAVLLGLERQRQDRLSESTP